MRLGDLREIVKTMEPFTDDLSVRVRGSGQAANLNMHLFPEIEMDWKEGEPTLYLEVFVPPSVNTKEV